MKALAAAEEIARQLNAEIPGARAWAVRGEELNHYPGVAFVRFDFDCPCGEVSSMQQTIEPHQCGHERYLAERMKAAMREHVRSEGNEPNF